VGSTGSFVNNAVFRREHIGDRHRFKH